MWMSPPSPEALSALTLPRLRMLLLPTYSSSDALLDFVARSGCALTTLMIVIVSWSTADIEPALRGCFSALPALYTLDIGAGAHTPALLARLAPFATALPNLSRLYIRDCVATDVDFAQLEAVCDARAPMLTHVELALNDDPFTGGVLFRSDALWIRLGAKSFRFRVRWERCNCISRDRTTRNSTSMIVNFMLTDLPPPLGCFTTEGRDPFSCTSPLHTHT
ncbi:hypothetical protein B0H17DRAFT_1067717 [Mycena rosella]|uniref:Uncharacterized protein n=1 Tax=Mycena rosella TaxID=1033263 RepID=A0AAD7DDS7_MYCRO|nr:hypothetical protein B0H17DRAFT_1067717 [Mycena rosella]